MLKTQKSITVTLSRLFLALYGAFVLMALYTPTVQAQTASTPFNGSAAAIPGRIEAENFDEGGEGVAYHDLTSTNTFGSTYRTGGVDVKDLAEASNAHVVSTTKPGEWLNFSVNIAQSGTYSVVMRSAGQGDGGTVKLQLNGSDLAGSTMTVPNTGSFSTFANSTAATVSLPSGQHKIRVYMVTAGASTQGDTGAIDYLTFISTGTTTPPPPSSSCGTTTAPATTYGQVKQSVNVTTAGTYRVWSRIKTATSANNSYYFQVDNGCAFNVGDSTAIPVNTWTWVNYQQNNTSSFVDVTLTAGTHQLTYTGREADVQLDRVLLLSDTSCTPTGLGDDCANVDTVNPTVSITSPASGSSVTQGSAVTISANASDNVGVTKVEFYVDGVLLNSDTTSPYSYSWSTGSVQTGSHSITARAYDAANNTTTSTAVTLNVTAPTVSDTTAPTVSLTSPANGSSVLVGTTVTVSATASDNVGVTKVEFYNGTTLLNTDTTSPYSYAWATTGQAAGTKTLTAKAYDAAGNSKTSTAVSFTLTSTPSTIPGDANNDGRVNGIDYSILSEHDGENYPAADFNGDGTVGAADLAILLSRWTW